MEIVSEAIEIDSSGILEEELFGIDNLGFILDLFRNSIYSNKIAAVCREISCNARDAHREVGIPDRPIVITLPNELEPEYRIRDFGPGISPDRMKNVFIRYGSSTKRTSNLQTGGFGIGAKTPFGYTDSFIINTFIDGTRRSYVAVIDDTKRGKLSLLDQSTTDEENGTEIVVPVLQKDFVSFKTETKTATRHWDVKPEVRGGTISYDDFAKKFSTDNPRWFIAPGPSSVFAVVDGVEYPVPNRYISANPTDGFGERCSLYALFGVGDLSISATRESLDFDERTIAAIQNVTSTVKTDISTWIQKNIENADSYMEANEQYHQYRSTFGYNTLGPMSWAGIPLTGKTYALSRDIPIGGDSDRHLFSFSSFEAPPEGGRRARKPTLFASSVEVDKDTIYVIDDIGFGDGIFGVRLSFAAAKTFHGYETKEEKVMNKTVILHRKSVSPSSYEDVVHLGLQGLDWVLLSSYYSYNAGNTKTTKSSTVKYYRWVDTSIAKLCRTKTVKKDTQKKFWIEVKEDGSPILETALPQWILNGSAGRVLHDLASTERDISIYGVYADETQICDAVHGMTPLEDLIREKMQDVGPSFFAAAESFVASHGKPSSLSHETCRHLKAEFTKAGFLDRIEYGRFSPLYEYALLAIETKEKEHFTLTNYHIIRAAVMLGLIRATGVQRSDVRDIGPLMLEIYTRYPMIQLIDIMSDVYLYGHAIEKYLDNVIQYVNMMDRKWFESHRQGEIKEHGCKDSNEELCHGFGTWEDLCGEV